MGGTYLAGFLCYGVILYTPPIMVGHALIDLMTVSWVLTTSLIPGFYEMMYNMAK